MMKLNQATTLFGASVAYGAGLLYSVDVALTEGVFRIQLWGFRRCNPVGH